MTERATFTYRNWRGRVSKRMVEPHHIWHGATKHHPEQCWLLHGWDVHKGAERDYRMSDITDWEDLTHA